MNISMVKIWGVLLFTATCCTSNAQNDFSLISSRIRQQLGNETNEQSCLKNVVTYLPLVQSDGSWPDIDYSNKEIAKWKPGSHLDRVKFFAYALITEGGFYHENADLRNAIFKTLRYWNMRNPKSSNWWHNEIATPQTLGEIMILLGGSTGQLPAGLQDSLLGRMNQGDVFKKTGANKLDIALHMIYRACITKNNTLMDTAVQQAFQPIVYTTEEGLQYDNSYQQHGPQLQISSYGLVFLIGEYKVASWLQGTGFALQGTKLNLLNNYLFYTFLPAIRGSFIDFNTEGRGISRPDILDKRRLAVGNSENTFLETVKNVCTEKSELVDEAIARISGTSNAGFNVSPVHNHFWKADYTQHFRQSYNFNVRMVSQRSKRTEAGNNENLLGKFLPDGSTNIQRSGSEYFNIMPIWEWDKIPGITSRDFKTDQPTIVQWGENGSTSFVGGVSDGKYGTSAYDMDYDSLKAKKAWFFFDKEVVCLGAGISSSSPENVVTTINQCWQTGKIIASENGKYSNIKKEASSKAFNWVWQDSIGYFFPEQNSVTISGKLQKGNWGKINASSSSEEISGQVFKMWINHGSNISNGTYAYVTVPSILPDEMKNYRSDEVIVLSNTDSIQAVEHKGLKMIGIVFYKPGMISAKDIIVSVDKPCILLIKENNDIISLSIADPLQNGKEVEVFLKTQKGVKKQICPLPDGNFAGASAHFKINF